MDLTVCIQLVGVNHNKAENGLCWGGVYGIQGHVVGDRCSVFYYGNGAGGAAFGRGAVGRSTGCAAGWWPDRTSVVEGKDRSGSVDLGGRRGIKKQNTKRKN